MREQEGRGMEEREREGERGLFRHIKCSKFKDQTPLNTSEVCQRQELGKEEPNEEFFF